MKQKATVLGIDLAKRVFHLVGMNETGRVVLTKPLTREALLPFIAQLSPVIIGTEACGGALGSSFPGVWAYREVDRAPVC